MAPGQSLQGAEKDGFGYDIHRYATWAAVPKDMQDVITDNGVYGEGEGRGRLAAYLRGAV